MSNGSGVTPATSEWRQSRGITFCVVKLTNDNNGTRWIYCDKLFLFLLVVLA